MFVMSHFDAKLGNSYLEVKENVRTTFPSLYDTKVLAKLSQMESLCLEELFKNI